MVDPPFLYWIPGAADNADRGVIERAGLAYAFDDKPTIRGAVRGPDGSGVAGVVVGQGEPTRVGYYPESQTWRRIPKSECWIGLYKTPTPEELIRKDRLGGYVETLGDGNTWQVPVARGAVESGERLLGWCALPTRIGMDDDGDWKAAEPVARYAKLWEIAQRFWDSIWNAESDGKKITIPWSELLDDAVTVLQANYRIDRVEAAIIGVLDGNAADRVMTDLVDWPTVEKWLAKKAAAGATPAGSSG